MTSAIQRTGVVLRQVADTVEFNLPILMKKRFKGFALILGATLLISFLSAHNRSFAQSGADSGQPGCYPTVTEYEDCSQGSLDEQKAEQYVLSQIVKGKHAKVEPGTKLRGCFIRDLLMRAPGIPHTGITINGAIINGPVDVRNEEINVPVELVNCTFLGDFNMERSHFSKGLSFEGSRFGTELKGPGRLDAEAANIDFDLNIARAQFSNCSTYLKSMRVGVDLSMRGTKFRGKVDFTGAVIGSNLFADKGDAADEQTEFFGTADFEGVKVGLDASLSDVAFHGKSYFDLAAFNSLGLQHAIFEDDTSFKSTRIVDFYLGDNPAGRFKGTLMIEDLTFQYMNPEDLDQLKEFAEKSNSTQEQARYNTQFYATLETMLRGHGHSDWGDEVFIAGKRKARERLPWYDRAWGYFLDGFIGYGRHVERLLLWSLIFIVLGCVVFRSRNQMELKNQNQVPDDTRKYCPFLYTLDLFLPFVELGYVDTWYPKTLFGRIYKPIHVMVGYLFIPIGLAAWTGIIK